MSGRPLRFVHASDFHLELPLFGVNEVPAHLRELFLESPYIAARGVFDAVLAEEASLLILAGDVLSARDAGPRAVVFLISQFERLAERGVPIYWATGRVDSFDGWPAGATLPDNVHVFPRGRAVETICRREGQSLARLIGVSNPLRGHIHGGDFYLDRDPLYSIAVAHSSVATDSLAGQGIDYWALGGEHQMRAMEANDTVAWYCGSPQGRQPAEGGPHGCLLVQTDENRQTRVLPLETNPIRWTSQRLEFDAETTREGLGEMLRRRLWELRSASPRTHLLVSWTLHGQGPLLGGLRHGSLAEELLLSLRADAGHMDPAAWSVELAVEPSAPLEDAWYEEDTILGAYLRRVRAHGEHEAEPLDLEPILPSEHFRGAIAPLVAMEDPRQRALVLARAARLGVELLRGDDASPLPR